MNSKLITTRFGCSGLFSILYTYPRYVYRSLRQRKTWKQICIFVFVCCTTCLYIQQNFYPRFCRKCVYLYLFVVVLSYVSSEALNHGLQKVHFLYIFCLIVVVYLYPADLTFGGWQKNMYTCIFCFSIQQNCLL